DQVGAPPGRGVELTLAPYLAPDLLLLGDVADHGGGPVDAQGAAARHELDMPVRLLVDAEEPGDVPVGQRGPGHPQLGGLADDPAVGRRVVLVAYLQFPRRVAEVL